METSFISLLDELIAPQPDLQKSASLSLIALGEKALPCLIGALEMEKYASAWPMILQIIQQIGIKSSIDDVIPLLLRCLKDSNKPIYKAAFNLLLTMGDSVIYSARDILAYSWSDDSWIQNTCTLLKEIDSKHLDILTSELLHLLKIGTEKNNLDEYAIGVLRNIGSPKANNALPILREKLLVSDREDLKQASIEALQSFDPLVVRPFIPVLKECLLDDSEVVRSSAQRVLASLEE